MRRALIVDDRPENLRQLGELLRGESWLVDEASHGAEALEVARRSRPDVVIADVFMPYMDGLTMLQSWRADPALRSIPVVVRPTTLTAAGIEQRALDLGAAAVISESVSMERLAVRIAGVVEAQAPVEPAGPPASAAAVPLLKPYDEALVHQLEDAAREAGSLRHAFAVRGEHLAEAQAQLVQLRKAAALGEMVSGIAHDFNNLLTIINGTAELALLELDEGSAVSADLRDILEAGQRAAELTAQLAAFARKEATGIMPVKVNQLLRGMLGLLRRMTGPSIDHIVDLSAGADERVVMADSASLGQVVMNLVANARDAMPQGGTLIVQTRIAEVAGETVTAECSLAAGTYVLMSVSDTGVGMDADTRERIFERFYTTKEPERGTGLGLATTMSIVAKLGGTVLVDSEPGRGSTFTVYLPCIPPEDGSATA